VNHWLAFTCDEMIKLDINLSVTPLSKINTILIHLNSNLNRCINHWQNRRKLLQLLNRKQKYATTFTKCSHILIVLENQKNLWSINTHYIYTTYPLKSSNNFLKKFFLLCHCGFDGCNIIKLRLFMIAIQTEESFHYIALNLNNTKNNFSLK